MSKYINPLTDFGKDYYALSTMHYALSEAQYASLNTEERRAYDADLKAYRDITNQLAYADLKGEERGFGKGFNKGRQEGETNEKHRIARNLKKLGMSTSDISSATGLSESEIKSL